MLVPQIWYKKNDDFEPLEEFEKKEMAIKISIIFKKFKLCFILKEKKILNFLHKMNFF
jgi:hypothetical protein